MCWECNYFDKPWHFHKEYELVLIDKAQGTRFIGDHVSHFKDGNLALIGPNIPHLYRNSEDYYKNKSLVAKSIFTEKGSALLNIAIVGGAVFPPIQGMIADKMGVQVSYLVPCLCFILIVIYGIFCSRRSALTEGDINENITNEPGLI